MPDLYIPIDKLNNAKDKDSGSQVKLQNGTAQNQKEYGAGIIWWSMRAILP